jgi:hypothetical protein
MARLSCVAESWVYDMVTPSITLGRQLLHDEVNVDFCHIADNDTILHQHCTITCENPHAELKRFVLDILGATSIEVNGIQYTNADSGIPLNNNDTVALANGLLINFVLPPALDEQAATVAIDRPVEYSREQPSTIPKHGQGVLTAPPIISAVAAQSGAGYYGALCADDGSVFRIRKSKTAIGSKCGSRDVSTTTVGMDCQINSSANVQQRALIVCGAVEPRQFTIRCLTKDAPIAINATVHTAFDGPMILSNQDVISFGDVQIIFCLQGEVSLTVHNRAAMKIQAGWRGYVARTGEHPNHHYMNLNSSINLGGG